MYEHLFSQILNLMYVKQELFFIYAEIYIALMCKTIKVVLYT